MFILKESKFSLFQEAVYAIEKDVDYIYNKAFKRFVDDIKNNNLSKISDYSKSSTNLKTDFYVQYHKGILFCNFYSDELKSLHCKEANLKKPIQIVCGVFADQSCYSPEIKNNHILISIDVNIANVFLSKQNLDTTITKPNLIKRVKNEVNEGRIKASISHELSHWIDDRKYELFTKLVNSKDGLLLRQQSVDTTYFEIQGQVHAVLQIKKFYKDDYEKFTLNDLLDVYNPLAVIAETLLRKYGKETLNVWLRYLLKRLSREGLLTKYMKLPIDLTKLLTIKI